MRTYKFLSSAFILLITFTITMPYAAAQNKKDKRPNPFDLIEILQKRIQELQFEIEQNANRTQTNANMLNNLDHKFTNTTQSLDNKFTGITGNLDHKITNTTHQASNNANQLKEFDEKFTDVTKGLDLKITNTTHQASNNANQLKELDKNLKNTTDSFNQKFIEITHKTDSNASGLAKLSDDLKHNVTQISNNVLSIDNIKMDIEGHKFDIIALKQNFTDVEKNVFESIKKTKFRSQKSDLLALENKRDFVQDLLLKKGITTITAAKIDELKNLLPTGANLKGLLETCDLGTKFEAAKGQAESVKEIFNAIKFCQALQRLHHIGLGDEDQFDEVSEQTALLLELLEQLISDPDTSS